jgi:protocatechuate 3,4-dioxygenase beta subunit
MMSLSAPAEPRQLIGGFPMTCLSRLFYFSLILTGTILICLPGAGRGQTPGARTKGTSSISGRVTVGDKPAAGIMITAGGLNQITDADGRYHLGGLSAGQILVSPAAPLYVIPSTSMYGPGKMVNLSAGEAVEGIDFKLTRGGVITGRVTDADARPLIEERISLLPVDENGAFAMQRFSISNYQMYLTDDRGIYRIYGLPAGRYKVSAGSDAGSSSGLNYAGYYPKTYYPDTSDPVKASVVDLNEGGEAKDIDIKLGHRAPTYTASGRIVDADTGQPLAGVPVAFGAIRKEQNQNFIAGTSSPGRPTNSQGEFRLEGIQPGHYGVFVSTDRFNLNPNARTGPSLYSDPVSFEIVDGDITDLEITAIRGLSLSGVVVPEGITDKKVLAGLYSLKIAARVTPSSIGVRVFTASSSTSAVAPDGSFQIEGLPPGKAMVNVLSAGGTDLKGFSISRIEREGLVQSQGIDMRPGENATGVRVYLSYGSGTIRGQIKVEGGTLPSEAMIFVMLTHDGAPTRSSSPVDSRGRFLIQNLPAGAYQVVMQIFNMGRSTTARNMPQPQRQEITVMDGTETEVSFTVDLGKKDGH